MSRTWERRDLHRHGHVRHRSSCPTGKHRFRTQEEADTALAAMDGLPPMTPGKGKPVRSYACDKCAGFHVSARRQRPHWAA